jgi:hypothetical protein
MMTRSTFRKSFLCGVTTAMLCIATQALAADVPQAVTHQGRLYDNKGAPVTGTLEVVFSIYQAVGAATPIWTEKLSVTFEDGYFSANLGELTPLKGILDGSVRYFGVQVGAEPEMTPRVPVNSVPYALVAGNAVGDLTPTTISIGGAPVIDATGKWVGDPTGLVGPTGADGAVGPIGPIGPTGADGAMGPMGPAGATGAIGPMGPMGVAGPVGAAGPTGAAGPAGAAGATGAAGPAGATGAAGAAGPAGATGIVATATIAGAAIPLAANATTFAFVGPTASVTVTATQRITGTASAPLATLAGTASFDLSLCYQLGAGTITLLPGNLNYQTSTATTTLTPFATASSAVPGTAGTYTVGLCGRNMSTTAISTVDWVNGWFQVTN